MSYLQSHLTDKEIAEIKVLMKSSSAVKKIADEIESFYDDPSKMLYREIVEISKVMASDLSCIRKGEGDVKIIGADKDDKLYDRVMKLLTDSAKIFDGIAKGKKIIDPIGAKNDEIKNSSDDGLIL